MRFNVNGRGKTLEVRNAGVSCMTGIHPFGFQRVHCFSQKSSIMCNNAVLPTRCHVSWEVEMRLADAVGCSVTCFQTAAQVLATPDLNLWYLPHYFHIYFSVADSINTKEGANISRETQCNSDLIRLQINGWKNTYAIKGFRKWNNRGNRKICRKYVNRW